MSSIDLSTIQFCDSGAVARDPEAYVLVPVHMGKALKSFQLSIYSYEVMNTDGSLRNDDDLSEKQRAKRMAVREKAAAGEALAYPVAGLGMNDNFELGSGRDVFMTLAHDGMTEISVYIRKNQLEYLKKFILQ